MARPWTPEEDAVLLQMNKAKNTLKTMARKFNRTETAIRLRIIHLGDRPNVKGRKWTPEEEAVFKREWLDENIANSVLVRHHNRTWKALQEKAVAMKLGSRPHNFLYFTVQDIASEMKVSVDRVYRWIKYGLKARKGGDKRRKYLIDVEDLLAFLKTHQDLYQASCIDRCLFCDEPDWLIEKRERDKAYDLSKNQVEWTNEEDKQLQSLYYAGWTLENLAAKFHRTEHAVRMHLYVIGCEISRPDTYSEEEVRILKQYCETHTIAELAKMLTGRTEKGIEYKCKALHIPYHFSKSRCKPLENIVEERT